MKIAVTGANGFIGRHVLSALKQKKISCVAADLYPPEEANAPLADEWVKMDIHNPPADVFDRLGRPDSCIHLVWSGLDNYKSLRHFEYELPGQYRFLSTLIRQGLQSLVVSGTCFEYGMQSGALDEQMATQPTNPYGFAKDMLRRQLQFLNNCTPYALTWARLFYLYGEGQSNKSLWSQLRTAVARDEARFPMSGGAQLRDYLPVETVAAQLAAFAVTQADLGTVNVCSGLPISVRDLVEGWIADNGWSIQPERGCYPYPDYEAMAFWGDNTKLEAWREAIQHAKNA